MLSTCPNLFQVLGSQFSTLSGKQVMYLRADTSPPNPSWCTTRHREKTELMEACTLRGRREEILLAGNPVVSLQWREFRPWAARLWGTLWSKIRTHEFCAHESPYSMINIRSSLSHLLFILAGVDTGTAASHFTPMAIISCSPFQGFSAQPIACDLGNL